MVYYFQKQRGESNMKRIPGTRYAYVYKDNSVKNVPLDRTLDELDKSIQEKVARLNKLEAAIRELESKLKEG